MSEQIDGMIDRAKRQAEDARSLARAHPDRFMERLVEGRWSPGEQIYHLVLSDRPYLETIDTSLREARIRGVTSEGPFRGGKIGNWFASSMAPPVKRRMKTLKKLHPPLDLTAGQVVQAFEEVRGELVHSLESARGVDLDRAKIRSPFFKPLRMPLFSAYEVLLIHGDRHLWLALQMLEGKEA